MFIPFEDMPDGILDTPVGLDPDFRSQKTQTLDLNRSL